MRLLKRNSSGEHTLTEWFTYDIPQYAILSHTWGPSDEEVTFQDILVGTGRQKAGYSKIQFCDQQATRDGLQYFWIDTCCIDKSNHTELSEAVNSMFRWYRNAAKCYVYLSDVSIPALGTNDEPHKLPWESAFRQCKWFTRAWTLQELIAPASVSFFSNKGDHVGSKRSLERYIHEITGIPVAALQGAPLSDFNVEERMSWAANRSSTRKEDMVYSLLGIFETYMPLIYGEGQQHALRRLRREIDMSYGLGYSSAMATAPGSTNLTQRAARHDPIVHRMSITESGDGNPLHEESTVSVRHCTVCNILFCLWIFLAVLSLAVGLWRSLKTSDEGKGFTDAAYVVAVGGLIIFPIQNRHIYRCKRAQR